MLVFLGIVILVCVLFGTHFPFNLLAGIALCLILNEAMGKR